MAQFWNATGKIEALGNSTITKGGTEYTVVKIRDDAGALFTARKVVCGPNTHTELTVGAYLTLLGFEADGKHIVFAVISGRDVSEDIAELAAGKGKLIRLGGLFTAMGALMALTIVGIIVTVALVPAGIRMLKSGAAFPDGSAMHAQLREYLSPVELKT